MDIPILRHQAASQVAPCAECLLWLSVTKAHEPTLDKVHGAARIHRRSAPGRCRKLSLKFATAANSVTGSRCDVTRLASIPRAEVPPSDSSSRRSSVVLSAEGRLGRLRRTRGMDLHRPIGLFAGGEIPRIRYPFPGDTTASTAYPSVMRSYEQYDATLNRGHCHVYRHTEHSPAEHCPAH